MRFLLILTALACGVANADILTFTDRTAFLAALSGEYYEEPFDSLPAGSLRVFSSPFSQNGYSYTISTTAGGGLFGGTVNGDRGISIASPDGFLTVSNFSVPIKAIGGNFYFDMDPALSSTVTGPITVSNGVDSDAVVNVGPTSSLTNFVGFLSTTPLTSLRFQSTAGGGFPDIDDMIVSPGVPEPGTIGLALAGLAAISALRKRR